MNGLVCVNYLDWLRVFVAVRRESMEIEFFGQGRFLKIPKVIPGSR